MKSTFEKEHDFMVGSTLVQMKMINFYKGIMVFMISSLKNTVTIGH